MRKSSPLTTGERRGIIALLILALIAVAATGISRCVRHSRATGAMSAVSDTTDIRRTVLTAPADSAYAPVSAKSRKRGEKRDSRHSNDNKSTDKPARRPDERLFLDEKQ